MSQARSQHQRDERPIKALKILATVLLVRGAAQKSMATSAITSPLLLMAMVVVNQGHGRWGGQSTIPTQQVI